MDGGLFQKDLSFAYACFGKAIKAGRKEGYYYQVLIDTLRGNIEKAKEDTRRAAVDNYPLPGVVE